MLYPYTVDSKNLECRPGTIYAGFPSYLGCRLGGHIPTFSLLLYRHHGAMTLMILSKPAGELLSLFVSPFWSL